MEFKQSKEPNRVFYVKKRDGIRQGKETDWGLGSIPDRLVKNQLTGQSRGLTLIGHLKESFLWEKQEV